MGKYRMAILTQSRPGNKSGNVALAKPQPNATKIMYKEPEVAHYALVIRDPPSSPIYRLLS